MLGEEAMLHQRRQEVVKLVELKPLVGRHFQGLPEAFPGAIDLTLKALVVSDLLHDFGVEFEASFPLGKNNQFRV